jgi:hypothetical protein
MKLFAYCGNFLKEGVIENFGVLIESEKLSFKECQPVLPFSSYKNIKNIYFHCADLTKTDDEEKVKVGFLKYKENYFFSTLINNSQIVLNPIYFKKSSFSKSFIISVFCDGKKKIEVKSNLREQIEKELDFYPMIDKIFSKFKQFDAVFEKRLYVSFKRRKV